MATQEQALTITIDEVVDYVVCPAKCAINRVIEKKPIKEQVLTRMRNALNDILVKSVGRSGFAAEDIGNLAIAVTSNLDYAKKEEDTKDIYELFYTLSNVIGEYEYSIQQAQKPIEVQYDNVVVRGAIDLVVKDGKKGYIYPAVVDFSKTKYEPWFNPIVYRAQLAIDYMNLMGSNTDIMVLGAGYSKRWEYDKEKYGRLIHSAMVDIARIIRDEIYPVRFGWWCKICSYRSICTGILETRVRK